MKPFHLLFMTTLFLTACATGPADHRNYLQRRQVAEPTGYTNFQHCRGYGCKSIDTISLPSEDWHDIRTLFTPASTDAAEERERISNAIGILETKVGAIAGTDKDIHGTFYKIGTHQHDCVDESTNTTVYLSILEKDGLLAFHDIGSPNTRIPLLHYMGRWPHTTATMYEKESNAPYAVDSWFHDNGHPAEIIPLDQWKAGWKPDN